MSTTLLAASGPTVGDPVAFRSVFAAKAECLIVLLADPKAEGRFPTPLVDFIRQESRERQIALVIAGGPVDDRAVERELSPCRILFLDSWARPLLPALASVSDHVLVLGESALSLLPGELQGDVNRVRVFPGLIGEADRSHVLDKAPPPGIQQSDRCSPMLEESLKSAGTQDYVLQNDWGIGDELLLSAVAREILRAHPELRLWIRSRYGFRFPKYVKSGRASEKAVSIETIYQNPVLYGPDSHSPFPRHLVQQMLDKFGLDTGLRVQAQDVRPELDLAPDRAREPGTVILHSKTNPRLPSKDWGERRWMELARLLERSGLRVRQVGEKEEPLLGHAEDLRGTPPGKLAEVFSRSSVVVCVVGFLMHLAEATRTPAVVIYGGREHPAIDGYPDQIHLSSEPIACRGRWGCHLAPDHDCPHGMKCMESISPDLVADQVLRLARTGAPR